MNTSTHASDAAIHAGFADPVLQSGALFRKVLAATSYPGSIVTCEGIAHAPLPLNDASLAICLSLLDFETTLWLDPNVDWQMAIPTLRFHCEVPITETVASADFAVIGDATAMPNLSKFAQGEEEYPDKSATLIVQLPSLTGGPQTHWSGPGVNGSRTVDLPGLPVWFWSAVNRQVESYPHGVDVFFTSGNALISLPRSISVEV